ncbi:hypothetical protein [Actinomadura sp. 3N508]|uniref:hypothetical protein n=1 Tax=Actinomadura sp. 3N508 TaxID=3375153 RepID=UPI00379350C1
MVVILLQLLSADLVAPLRGASLPPLSERRTSGTAVPSPGGSPISPSGGGYSAEVRFDADAMRRLGAQIETWLQAIFKVIRDAVVVGRRSVSGNGRPAPFLPAGPRSRIEPRS